ncbi:Peroxidase 31, putative isoform 1 [Hibiscus syriacus]|uniref:Peroxidase 31, putative isoform 1 n=1 Tax=Hibiscus syriacus TaxID=106335 RepID=A0A6A3C197_HIBSY|nr:Peroxidase 31, putative isoform 1 [Hibiscus syriacus]
MSKRKSTAAPATDDPPHLQPGSQIEISSNDPGSEVHVEYTHLFEDVAGTKPLRETIDAVDIRPAPREKARKFKFSEEVDAFHNDGWWEGVITKELGNGRFHVYFKRSKEQLEFGEDQKLKSDLAGSGGKSESSKITEYSEGDRVEVTSDEDGFEGAWFTGTIVKAVGKNKYLFQYDSLRTDDESDFLKEEFDACTLGLAHRKLLWPMHSKNLMKSMLSTMRAGWV